MARTRWSLALALASLAGFVASPGGAQQATAPNKPFAGPLKPDLPLAKGYDDAARALAMVDDNPLIRWEYRVWCQTGYRNVEDAGTGQEIDKPVDLNRDHITPKGFHIIDAHATQKMPPGGARFMDNAWYVGSNSTGGVIVKTPDGLIVLDTLRDPVDFDRVLSEMPLAGLDPKDIKYVFLGHQHGDHLAGANAILKIAPRAKIVMGAPDAKIVEDARKAVLNGTIKDLADDNHAVFQRNASPKTAEEAAALKATRLRALPERIDIRVPAQKGVKTGSMRIRIGPSTEVVAILAPGHTVGQMHVIVPVQHKGATYKLLVLSGNDLPSAAAQYAISMDYVRSVAAAEGADVLINTHAYQSSIFFYLRQLAADPAAPNPLMMGVDGVDRYLAIFADCQRAIRERLKDGTWRVF